MSLQFDGVDDDINWGDLSVIDGASALTVSVWLLSENLGLANDEAIWAKGTTASGFEIRRDSLNPPATPGLAIRVHFDVAGGIFAVTTNDFFNSAIGEYWIHFGMIYDGAASGNDNRLRVFRDGEQQQLTFTGTIPATMVSTAIVQTVAEAGTDFIHDWEGRIDRLHVWTEALPAGLLQSQMWVARPVKHDNLVYWCELESIAGNAVDFSGNKRTGTVNGAGVGFLPPARPPLSWGG